MYAPVEVVPVEPVALEVVSFEAMVHGGATGVTAPETVAANACRLNGHADRKHDCQCGERHEGHLLWT